MNNLQLQQQAQRRKNQWTHFARPNDAFSIPRAPFHAVLDLDQHQLAVDHLEAVNLAPQKKTPLLQRQQLVRVHLAVRHEHGALFHLDLAGRASLGAGTVGGVHAGLEQLDDGGFVGVGEGGVGQDELLGPLRLRDGVLCAVQHVTNRGRIRRQNRNSGGTDQAGS